jgi:predicted dehydrogenase
MAAIAAGKHIVVEKPFALNVAQAREMADAANAAGLTAMVGHEFRFSPQRLFIKQLLDEGYVGTPQLVQVELLMGGRPMPEPPPPLNPAQTVAMGAGFIGGLGSHFLDALRHWFGDVAEVRGVVRTLRPDRTDPATSGLTKTDVEDTFQCTLTFTSGVVASMTASSAVGPSTSGRTFIGGTEGALFATQPGPNPLPDGVVLGAKAGERTLTELPMPPEHRPFEDERDQRLVAFRLMVREFERGIREGTSPSPSLVDGLWCRKVMDAIRESSDTGRAITLAE